jgi:hypothetical protein
MSNAGGMATVTRYTDMLAGNTTWNPWEPDGAYDALATVTLSSATSTITFAGIPNTYKHLQIRALARSTFADTNTYPDIRFNGDSGSNYSWHILDGNGSSASAGAGTSQASAGVPTFTAGNSTANIFGVLIMDILDYANTTNNKTVRYLGGHDQNGSGILRFSSGSWRNTSAINSITFTAIGGANWAVNTQFSLYGVK